MSYQRRYYLTNSNRLSEYHAKLAACTVGIHRSPASFCSACGEIFRSMPYAIRDGDSEEICDFCAANLRLPVLDLKQSADAELTMFEDLYRISPEYSYFWRVGVRKREKLRLDFHARALIETVCDRCAAYGLNQAYLVCLPNAPMFTELTCSYRDPDMVEEVFRRVEKDFSRLIETGQSERCRIEYFYVVDAMEYPPGLTPVKPDDLEPDLPSWKWPVEPES